MSNLAQAATPAVPDVRPADIVHHVVIGHPAAGSFNHALARAYAEAVAGCGQAASANDLYASGFDPLLRAHERVGTPGYALSHDVRTELRAVERASVIVLVYPIWFGMPPAAIVGYVDRVLGAGLAASALRTGRRHELLAGKQLVLLTTSGATHAWLAERGQWYGLREAFDFYLESIFSFEDCQHEHFDSIVAPLNANYAGECLERVRERACATCSTLLSGAHAQQKRAKLGLAFSATAPARQ